MPNSAAGLNGAAQGINACLVARRARQATARGPAAIAIHDDGNMTRHGGRSGQHGAIAAPQTCMISASFAFKEASISLIVSSVIFWVSSDFFL